MFTGVELPKFTSRNHEGNIVCCRYPKDHPKEIEKILLEIEKRGIPLSKVTLLSPKKFDHTIISDCEPVFKLIKKGVQYTTIHGFKGLENNIIILYDFENISSDQMQRLMYVGISRATQELYLVLDQKLEESVARLVKNNYSKTLLS